MIEDVVTARKITQYIQGNPDVKARLLDIPGKLQKRASDFLTNHGSDTINPMDPRILPEVQFNINVHDNGIYDVTTHRSTAKVEFGLGRVIRKISDPEDENESTLRSELLEAIHNDKKDHVLEILTQITESTLAIQGYGSLLEDFKKLDPEWVQNNEVGFMLNMLGLSVDHDRGYKE